MTYQSLETDHDNLKRRLRLDGSSVTNLQCIAMVTHHSPWLSDSTSKRQSSWRPPPPCPGSIDQPAPQELPPHTTAWLPRGPGGQDGRLCRVGVFSVFMPFSKYLICDQPTSWPIVKNDPKVPAACAIFRPGHLRKPSPHQALVDNHDHHYYYIYHSWLGTGDVW